MKTPSSILRRRSGDTATNRISPAGGLLLAACVVLAACAQNVDIAATKSDKKGGQVIGAFTRFPDMPLPKGANIDLERTLIFGASESWFGRLVLDTAHGADDMFGFFTRELVRFGWQEITSVRSAISMLTYSRQGRIATIRIQGGTLRGSEVVITVSPEGGAQSAPPLPPTPASGQKNQ